MLKRGSGRLHSIAVLALCAIFFLLAMGITLLGSNVYRGVVASADKTDTQRTALHYLVNQVRRGDARGGVAVGTFQGVDAVVLTEGDYVTYLYCWGGNLMELYMERGTALAAADGVSLLPLSSLSMKLEEGLITFTADGHSVAVSPRCGAEWAGDQ